VHLSRNVENSYWCLKRLANGQGYCRRAVRLSRNIETSYRSPKKIANSR